MGELSGLAIAGAVVGLVGGIIGILSGIWALLSAPGVSWKLQRVEMQLVPLNADPHTTITYPPPNQPDFLYFVFRNTGSATARDVRVLMESPDQPHPLEYPDDGWRILQTGEEIEAGASARRMDGVLADRPYGSGDDDVFDLHASVAIVKWKQPGIPWTRSKRFDLDSEQYTVPLKGRPFPDLS